MQNEKRIWDWLKTNSPLSDCAVAAIMGNIEAESAGLPNNVENRCSLSDAEYTARVDNGTINREVFARDGYGYGLFQHTYFSRKYALWDFTVSKGISISNLEAQLQFMLNELQTSYKTVWNSLMTASSIAAPCSRFLHLYENPANASAQESKRYDMAAAIYDRQHKTETTTATTTTAPMGATELSNKLLDIITRHNQITEDLKELVEECQMLLS